MGQGAAPSGQLSPGEQEALKGQIQQLLKQMSGELKQLQSDLANQRNNQANPLPGTGTDAELYGGATPLDPAHGSQLPIQLDVDAQATSRSRRGTGTGDPSGRVSDATPQMAPEHATLATQAEAEEGVRRQTIPPEYKPVFEHLWNPTASSSVGSQPQEAPSAPPSQSQTP